MAGLVPAIRVFPSGDPRVSLRSPGDTAQRGRPFRPLCSVFGTALPAVLHALGVEHAAQDVVAHARQVLDAPAADHHHRVLLQVMALARDVTDHLEPVGQPHLCDLAQRRVRLLGRGRVDPGAHAALLRALLQRRHLLARVLRHPRIADQLVDGRHRLASPVAGGRGPGSLVMPERRRAKRNRAMPPVRKGARSFQRTATPLGLSPLRRGLAPAI